MAALLRSARLLKFSPSGVLQITGTKRTGPPLCRLFSGPAAGRRSGVYARQIGPVWDKASSCVWPRAAGCVRRYAVATEQKDEVGVGLRSKQAQQFDWALTKLDSSVRRTGRITKTLLLRIFHDICRKGYPSGNQALLLLRSCGSLLPEVGLEERTELAHHVWEKLRELGAQYDVSHYNALLKVYLQNEFKFSPTDFLAKMEAANVLPNRVTYQRLIAAYCQSGDIEGASTILGFMKSKDLPITEAVFSSLVTGHARAGDLESAKNILPIMKRAGIEPGPETFLALLNVYAEKGDLEGMKETLEAAESADYGLMDRDIMQVILTLTRSGHKQLIPEMCERLRHERGYVPDAMNLCLNLITLGHDDTAFHLLKTFPSLQSENGGDSSNVGNFFLRHCVTVGTPVEKIASYCKELQESDFHSAPLSFSLSCALEAKDIGLSIQLMKLFKEQNLPIRPHYFWPLLTQQLKDKNTDGVLEVMKGMQELGVSPDTETLSRYILPVFPNAAAAQQAVKDAGLSMGSEQFLSSQVRSMAASDLAELYKLLSDPSVSSLDIGVFRSNLISGFRKSSDVESMVKITALLHEDERFSKGDVKPAESVSYFLYNLIDSMSEGELQAQESKLRSFFNQLKAQNIKIPVNIFRGIRKLLVAQQVPDLIKDVMELVDPKERGDGESASNFVQESGVNGKILALEKKLAELKAENKPVVSILKPLMQTLSVEEKLERALELKQQHEDEMTAGCYAILINLCCRHNNVEEAINLKRELSRKDSSVVLDANKSLALIKALAMSDRLEEALDILKEMKEKEVVLKDANITTLFHLLNSVATAGAASSSSSAISAVQRLLDTVFSLGLAKPSANLCSPLITAYLESNDVSGALAAAFECQKRYSQLPRFHDIVVSLVEKGDTDSLQKAMDFVSQERGEMTMLYDLFFAFLQTGRNREARKIIETPGLRAKPGRLQWYAEKCISSNQMEALEQMVDMTSKLFECDRDEMYCYLLRLCKETSNWQKAEAVWTKMQEENVIPRERTLRLLADILRTNGQEVPFEEPETWYQQTAAPEQPKPVETSTPADSAAQYQARVLALCKKGKGKEAHAVLKEAGKAGVVLGPSPFDHTIRALLAEGSIEDAMAVRDIARSCMPDFKLSEIATSLLIITHSKKGQVKDALQHMKAMLQSGQVPMQIAFTKLVQAMGSQGDLSGIEDVQSLVNSLGTNMNLSTMLFVNNSALAHIHNGDLDSAVELLEGVYTSPDSTNPSISFVFRKVLEADDDKALDKLSVMAERLANHFACYRPASDLFLQLLDQDKVEDAKFMLARCNAVAEQKEVLLSYVAQRSQSPGQLSKIQNLLSLIPDFADKAVLYSYLMKCHVLDKDLPAAKALHEQMQKEGIAADELSLKRLAGLYREAGETLPFPEPPESFRFYADKLKQKSMKTQATTEE
ncbi:leucine-rich PPR motif-containing protein, mitochondrial [Salarias fasciatus]|uniref:Pentacotripeptide-repeat region of PRORP domain-containing protein n=1 Tax=Salarias fasciatus TaxID=181472 RepID=A0A672JNT3_SALFA|nr:leucine-rich PPR motif-containing protein, mitochondrial [Salarias fasciatus]